MSSVEHDHPPERYLSFAVGMASSLILFIPIFRANVKNHRKFKTQSQTALLASTSLFGLYLGIGACLAFFNYASYDEPDTARLYLVFSSANANILMFVMLLLTGVIVERLCVIQPSGERTRFMNVLHVMNLALRLGSIVLNIVFGFFGEFTTFLTVIDLTVAVNALVSILVDLMMNFLVARRIYTGSVAIVKEYHGENNSKAMKLAKRLFLILGCSTTFEVLSVVYYLVESGLSLYILAFLPPLAMTAHFGFETIYQKEVRKIYLTREDFESRI